MPTPQDHFTRLLEAHKGLVLRLAALYCRDPEERRDLAQEITAQLWRAFPRYDGTRPFATWLYRIGLNTAITLARRSGRRIDASEEGLDGVADRAPDDPLVDDEQIALLRAVIDRQAPLDRALLLLWLEERTHAEMAEILGLTTTNVATKLHRLRQRLRSDLSPQDPR